MRTHSPGNPTRLILLAEDDPIQRSLVSAALRLAAPGIEVREVVDGRELLDYLRREGDYENDPAAHPPGLILLDLQMPRMGGIEALTLLKADRALRVIPVVVLTAGDDPDSVARCYDLGVNSFIAKSANGSELVRALGALVHYWFEVAKLPPIR